MQQITSLTLQCWPVKSAVVAESIAEIMENTRKQPYPGGFVVSKSLDLDVPSTYEPLELPGSLKYWRDRSADSQVFVNRDEFVIVHGLSLYVGESPRPLPELLYLRFKEGREAFFRELSLVGGRYVVICHVDNETMFVQDPFGARSVYFSLDHPIVSSHANLIQDAVPHSVYSNLDCSPALAWDLSPYSGIIALMPNTFLKFEENEVYRYFPNSKNRFLEWPESEKLSRIEDLWGRQLEALRERGARVAFSMTGGSDSRVLLAMARKRVSELQIFTYTTRSGQSDWSKSLALDATITAEILEDLQLDHKFLHRQARASATVPPAVLKNSFQHHGQWLLPLYQNLFPSGDVLHMRGNLLEVGRSYWITPSIPDSFEAARRVAQRYSRSSSDKVRARIDERMRAVGYAESMWGYDRRDLLAWELRHGRWLAEVLNETDAAFETFLPLNVREIMELLLSFNLADRLSNRAAWELVDRNWPVLNFYGRNDARNLYEQARDAESMSLFSGGARSRFAGAVVGPKRSYEIISSAGQVLSSRAREASCYKIRADEFLLGNALVVTLANVGQQSDVQFSYTNEYFSESGSGVFHFEVLVNHVVVLTEDGNAWSRANSVSLGAVPAGSEITFRIVVDRSNPRPSWESASVTELSEVRRFNGRSGRALKVASSSPYAKVLNAD